MAQDPCSDNKPVQWGLPGQQQQSAQITEITESNKQGSSGQTPS